jgi:hypothetical protein
MFINTLLSGGGQHTAYRTQKKYTYKSLRNAKNALLHAQTSKFRGTGVRIIYTGLQTSSELWLKATQLPHLSDVPEVTTTQYEPQTPPRNKFQSHPF